MPTEYIWGGANSSSSSTATSLNFITKLTGDGSSSSTSDVSGGISLSTEINSTAMGMANISDTVLTSRRPSPRHGYLDSTAVSIASAEVTGFRIKTIMNSTASSQSLSFVRTGGEYFWICGQIRQSQDLAINNDPTGWYEPFDVAAVDPGQSLSPLNKALLPMPNIAYTQRWVVEVNLTWVCDLDGWDAGSSLTIKAVTTFSSQLVVRTLYNESVDDADVKTQSLIALIDFAPFVDPTEELIISVQYTGTNAVTLDKNSSSLSFYEI